MRDRWSLGLLLLGLAQMVGELAGVAALRGLAAATCASPAPKVFSAVRGLETYSTRFFVEWRDPSGKDASLELTPEVYARIRGPYNRRNVFGAALAYGPILVTDPRTKPLFDSVAAYALCGNAPLLAELGVSLEEVAGSVRVRLEPRPGTDLGQLPREIEAPCR